MSLPPDLRARLRAARQNGLTDRGLQALDAHLMQLDGADCRHTALWQGLTDMHATTRAKGYFQGLGDHPSVRDQIAYAKFLWLMGDVAAAHKIMPYAERLGPKAQSLAHDITTTNERLLTAGLRHKNEVAAALFKAARAHTKQINGRGTLFYTGQLGAGGAETQFTKMALSLSDQSMPNWPIYVAVRHTDPARSADFQLSAFEEKRIPVHVLDQEKPAAVPWAHSIVENLIGALPQSLRDPVLKLANYIKRIQPASVYAWQDGGVLIAALAAALAGAPQIITSFRGLPPSMRPKLFKPEYEPLYRTVIEDTGTTFTANNLATAKAYAAWLDLSDNRIAVLRNSVEAPIAAPLPEDKPKLHKILEGTPNCTQTILGVFRCDPVKQPQLWFKSAIEILLANPHVRAIHIGDTSPEPLIQKMISEAGLGPRLSCIGLTQRVGFWMANADLLLHLAQFEGSPNVVIEAQMSGLPVLATPAGGTPEEVTNNISGRLMPTTSPKPQEVRQAVQTMLNDPQLCRKLASNALRSARDMHDPNHVRAATLELLRPVEMQAIA